MAPAVIHIVAIIAGLAIVATGFTVMPGTATYSLLKGTALAIVLAVTAALLLTAARQFG